MDRCGIYVLRNSVNEKVYVGQSIHIEARFREHRKSARLGAKSHLYDAMRCHGIANFRCELLEECGPEQFDEREAYWMSVFDCRNAERGYNFMPAGQRGRVMDQAMRDLLSERARGYKHTQQALEKMRAASTGKKHSDETKAKMARAHTGKVVSEETLRRFSAAQLRRWEAMSEEDRLEHAAKRIGRQASEATKQKMSERRKGKPKSAAHRAKISAAAKARTPESDARRLAALREANKKRWGAYRLEKAGAAC